MSGIKIVFPENDDFDDLAAKLASVEKSFLRAGKALQSFSHGGLRGGVGALIESAGLGGTGAGLLASAGATAIGFGVKTSIDSYLSKQVAQYATGGTDSQISMLAHEGAITGGGISQMSGMANSLADKLREGGIASGWARSQGIVDLGPYTMNKVDNLTRAIDALKKIQDSSYRMFLTRELLGPEAAPLIEMSSKSLAMNKWFSEQSELTNADKKQLGDVNTFLAGLKELTIGGAQKLLANATNRTGEYNWMDWFNLSWGASKAGHHLIHGDKSSDESSHDQAMKDHTDAMRDHTRASREEKIHMGKRAERAWSKAWVAGAAELAMKERIHHLGGV